MHRGDAERRGLEALDAERLEDEIIFRRRAHHLVVRRRALSTKEPVAGCAIQVSRDERAHVRVRLQRLAGAEIILVIILDVAEFGDRYDAMVVLAERRAREDAA